MLTKEIQEKLANVLEPSSPVKENVVSKEIPLEEKLKSVLGPVSPPSNKQVPSSTPKSKQETKKTPANQPSQIWGGYNIAGYKTKYPELDIDPSVDYETLNEDALTFGDLANLTGAVGASYLEGFLYGRDVFSIDNKVELHPMASYVANMGGEITRMIGAGYTSNIIVGQLLSIPAITRAIATGGNTGNYVISKLPLAAQSTAVVGSKALSIFAREAGEALVFSLFDQIVAPEERKPGLWGTLRNISLFGWSGVGQVSSVKLLNTLAPNANPGLQRLVGFVGNNVIGSLGSFPFYDSAQDMVRDMFTAETIAIGVVDMLTYAISSGALKRTSEVDTQLKKVEQAQRIYDNNKTLENQKDVYRAVNDLYEVIAHSNKEAASSIDNLVIETTTQRFLQDIEKAKTFKPATEADAALLRKKIDGDYVPKKPGFDADTLAKKTLDEGGWKTSEAEAQRLAEATPRKGEAINTKRFNTSADTRKVIMEFAEIVNDPTVQPHAVTKERAAAMVKDLGLLNSDVDTLAKALEKAPETVTALRMTVETGARNLNGEAKRLYDKGINNITDLELAQFIHAVEHQKSLVGDLKYIWKQFGRALNSGNIVVDGEVINLTDPSLHSDVYKDLRNSTDFVNYTNKVIDAAGGKAKALKLVTDIASGKDSVVDINNRVRKVEPSLGRKLAWAGVELRTTNLLSQTITSLSNVISQTVNMAMDVPVDFAAATYNTVGTMINKLRGKPFDGGITYKEAWARAAGNAEGLYKAFTDPIISIEDVSKIKGTKKPTKVSLLWDFVVNPMKLEELLEATSFDPRRKVEGLTSRKLSSEYLLPSNIEDMPMGVIAARTLDQVGAWTRLAGYGMMDITDRPFSSAAYYSGLQGELERLSRTNPDIDVKTLKDQVMARRAQKQAMVIIESELNKAGLTGAEATAFRKTKMAEITEGKLDGLSKEQLKTIDTLDSKAMAKSQEMTWKDPISSEWGRNTEKYLNSHPLGKIFVPFFHTPVKLMEKWRKMSGLSIQQWKDITGRTLTADGKVDRFRQTRALGQLTVAYSLYAYAISLFLDKKITPTARTPEERRAMEEAGTPENSMKIGDKWYQIGRYDPYSTFLITSANLMRALMEGDDEEENLNRFADFLFLTMQNTLSETWMTGIREAIDATRTPDGFEKYVSNLGKSLNPAYPVVRNAITNPPENLNPLYKDHLHDIKWGLIVSEYPRTDTYGKPIMNYQSDWGVRYREETTSPIRQEMYKLGKALPKLPKVIGGVELTEEQYWNMNRYFAEVVKAEEAMNDLVTSSAYRRGSVEYKKEAINKYWSKLSQKAKSFIMTDPEYQQAYRENLEKIQRKRRIMDFNFNIFD